MSRKLDSLYEAWMKAEAAEQAALLMLGARDDVEMRAQYERAVDACEEARVAYEAALRPASARVA